MQFLHLKIMSFLYGIYKLCNFFMEFTYHVISILHCFCLCTYNMFRVHSGKGGLAPSRTTVNSLCPYGLILDFLNTDCVMCRLETTFTQ